MIFLTKLKAIDPKDGEVKTWGGPMIEAICWSEAEHKIKDKGYLEIDGVLWSEIDFETGKRHNNAIMN